MPGRSSDFSFTKSGQRISRAFFLSSGTLAALLPSVLFPRTSGPAWHHFRCLSYVESERAFARVKLMHEIERVHTLGAQKREMPNSSGANFESPRKIELER